MRYPEIGDIWQDDDGIFYLFLREPRWFDDAVLIYTLTLNDGSISPMYFPINYKTGTIEDWYWKVA